MDEPLNMSNPNFLLEIQQYASRDIQEILFLQHSNISQTNTVFLEKKTEVYYKHHILSERLKVSDKRLTAALTKAKQHLAIMNLLNSSLSERRSQPY